MKSIHNDNRKQHQPNDRKWITSISQCLTILILIVFSSVSIAAGYHDDDDDSDKKCKRIHVVGIKHCGVPNKKPCALRDQFTTRGLVQLSEKLVEDYFSGNKCHITLPVWSWTGQDPIPTREDLPTETIDVSSLNGNELAERLLSLAGLLLYELEPAARAAALSTDVLDTEAFKKGKDQHTAILQGLMELLTSKNSNGEIALDEAHEIALLVGASHFQSLTTLYADDNYAYAPRFEQLYSGVIHKFYNQLQSADTAFVGLPTAGNWASANWAYLNFLPPEILGFTEENIEAFPQALRIDYKMLKKMLKWEKKAVGKYFWPRMFTDTANSFLFTYEGVDPDGYSRPADLNLENFDRPGFVMTYDWLEALSSDFKDVNVDAPLGIPSIFSYEPNLDAGAYGVKDLIETLASSNVANKVTAKAEKIWNNKIAPIYQELLALSEIRRAESHDDFYVGSWRAKIPKVKLVNRDGNGNAINFVATIPGKGDITVPINAPLSSNKMVRKLQQDVAEMDKWFNDNLEVAQDLHPGNEFNLLFREDDTRGITELGECVANSPPTPYVDIQEIIDNYSTEVKIVDVDASLGDLVFQGGNALSLFLFDLREFIANEYVKENFADFDFASAATAGLCKVNQANHQVTYQEVRDILIAEANGTFETSDVAVLGRHYGYKVNGDPEPTERDGSGNLIYTYQDFDYIYRQHFAVDNSIALTPTNVTDPQTGKMFYQYTDPGDDARQDQFLADFSALEVTADGQLTTGKLGSYYRWKTDWVMQKIAAFIISVAPSKNLLPQAFVDSYFASTFEDINDVADQCGFGLVKSAPETIRFRISGQLGGSANAISNIDFDNKIFTTNIRLITLNPLTVPKVQNNLSLLLHEGALGHGFDSVPNIIDLLRGNPSEISWLSVVNNFFGILTEGQIWTYPVFGPGGGTLFEGWATYGEVQGVLKGLVVKFDSQGCPIPGAVDNVAAFNGVVLLSRVGARQVVSVAENLSKYAWTFYRSVEEFTRLTDIPILEGADFHTRFVGHPTQQTTYAAGLITNLGILSLLKEEAAAQGCAVNEPAFNQFRITRTDYILGAPLNQIVQDNLDDLIDCP